MKLFKIQIRPTTDYDYCMPRGSAHRGIITTISLILSPIILSILQGVSYIEVQVDRVLRYE